MAVTESWVLDGLDISSGNFQILELNADPPKDRPEFVSAADSEFAALTRQPLFENRTITFKLRVTPQASMDAAMDQVGLLVDKLRNASELPDGVALVWTPANSTRSRTFDVIDGQVTELPIALDGHGRSWFVQRPIVTIELTAKPYWRGAEVTTSSSAQTTPVATLEVANVPGDMPALGRLIITDSATQARRHVEWGLENQFYNSGLGLIIDSDSMSVSGLAGSQTTRTGAYDPNATGNNVIRTTLAPAPVACCDTGNQSHIGTYRVKARVWASTANVRVRLSWKAGDTAYFPNSFAVPPSFGFWSEVDLGVITIPTALAGTQRWVGRIEAYSTTAGDTIDVDYLTLVPAGEGYGKARGETVVETVTVYSARDEFDQTAGALTGKTAPVGGTWAGAGSANDWQVTSGLAVRTALSDTDLNSGRYMTVGTGTFTDVLVQAGFNYTGLAGANNFDHRYGVLARYTDTNNWVLAALETDFVSPAPTSFFYLKLYKRVAGTVTTLQTLSLPVGITASYHLRLVIDSSGNATVFYGLTSFSMVSGFTVTDSALATGGTLATGKVGFYDAWTGNIAFTRASDDFMVAVPSPVQVIYSTRNMQVRFDDTIRQDSTGTYTGRPPAYRGTRFLVPPGTSRVLVKARRQDIEEGPDENVADSTTVQVAYQPRGLVVPR